MSEVFEKLDELVKSNRGLCKKYLCFTATRDVRGRVQSEIQGKALQRLLRVLMPLRNQLEIDTTGLLRGRLPQGFRLR